MTTLKEKREKTAALKRRPDMLRRLLVLGLVLLAAVALWICCSRSISATPSFPRPISFVGEYSQNGGAWQPITEDTRFNALDGDLVLRGNFDAKADTAMLHAYLDCICVTVIADGETEFQMPAPDYTGKDAVCVQWQGWQSAALSAGTVEIRLSNPMSAGNPNAYNEFLDRLYAGPKSTFENYILYPGDYLSRSMESEGIAPLADFLSSGQFWRGVCVFILLYSLFMLGVAFADMLQSRLFGKKLWLLTALSLFSFGMIILDTPDVSIWNNNAVFNTCGAQFCRMLWMLMLSLGVAELCGGRRRQGALAAAAVGGVFDAGVFLLCATGKLYVTDTVSAWVILQFAVCAVLLPACGMELRQTAGQTKKFLLFALLLICAVLAELCSAWFGFWQRGLLLNSVIALLLLGCMIWSVKALPDTYHMAKRAREQEKELLESRVSIMLSQIQPHFLYNALSSIRQLCESDPEAAQTAIEDFARYLRGNLDSIKRSTPVPFTKELEHIQIYLSLEKMRFEDDLRVVWDVEADGFMLPALTVQPLVENAVKYGVGKKPGGGTVTISTKELPDRYTVTVQDDGVGYDPNKTQDDGRTHIGIDNVRSRLSSMCGGELSIESTPGQGTVAVITIPKEAGK